MSARAAIGLLALVPVLALAGCGDDEEATTGDARVPDAVAPKTGSDEEQAGAQPTGREEGRRTQPPREDEVPGGPGDEIPASGPADFTGRGGRVGPRIVRVPPFLGIAVTLRSGDGGDYGLRIAGKTLRVDGSRRTASVRVEGLRPGKSYVGTVRGSGERVRIEPSAEPGP